MKRWYLVAAVGVALWPVAARAQEGLAPTAPVVPAPVLQNGTVLAPAGGSGWGAGGPKMFSVAKWSPFRNPATASAVEPTAGYGYAQPQFQAQALPPLPYGLSAPDAACGPTGCGRPGRDRSCWERIRALLCFHDSPTELPKLRPTPYVTPLIGMFPCTPVGGSGCATGGAGDNLRYGVPSDRQPSSYPQSYAPVESVPQPVTANKTAGAVMPPRGTMGGPVQPTWQGRVVPATAVTAKPAPGPIVPTGYKYPAPTQK